MRGLERAIEWLRPIVENGLWDYCVIWKLGDDPNRFIEWLDCCCIGAYCNDDIVKEDKQNHKAPICRYTHVEHPVKTMACKALANFPSFIPLYSGIHGDVILKNEPMWLDHASADGNTNSSASDSSNEEVGTRVLVPIGGGLIELFVAKHVEKDQRIIDFVRAHSAQCSDIIKVEAKAEQINSIGSFNELPHNLLPELPIKIEPSSLQSYGLSSFSCSHPDYSLTYPLSEGSFSVSNFDQTSFNPVSSHASHYECLKQSVGNLSDFNEFKNVENSRSQEAGLLEDVVVAEKNASGKRYPSRNLVAERNRRVRIRGGLYALRALVPKISKMDKSSILGDAIDYIDELKKKLNELEDELKNTGEEDCEENNGGLKKSNSDNQSVCTRRSPTTEIQDVISHGEKKHVTVSVDIHQLDKREFRIKIICGKQQGGFVRLVQALNSLGFQVVNINVTTSHGTVLYVLNVEGCKEEIHLKNLRKSLMERMIG